MEEVVKLAKTMEDVRTQAFVITGVLVCSDKFIDREYAKSVRRYLSMTKVFQILEEEYREAIEKTSWNERQQTAICMLKNGENIAKIEMYARLTRDEIEKISKEMTTV